MNLAPDRLLYAILATIGPKKPLASIRRRCAMERYSHPDNKLWSAYQDTQSLQNALTLADTDHPALRHIREALTIASLYQASFPQDPPDPAPESRPDHT